MVISRQFSHFEQGCDMVLPNMPLHPPSLFAGDIVAPVLGGDDEFANFILGLRDPKGTGRFAAPLLLQELKGIKHYYTAPKVISYPNYDRWTQVVENVQDRGRKFLPATGGCGYVDLDHIELPLPEQASAYGFVAATHASIRILQEAQSAANAKLREGLRLQVLATNSDGKNHAFGSHLNVLLGRKTFNDLIHFRMPHMLYLASYLTSSIVFTGLGKVGSENGTAPVDFQVSQRADFFETLSSVQTTYQRGIVNCRDEAHCGSAHSSKLESCASKLARLHIIFYDSNLCPVSLFLKGGVMQLISVLLAARKINPDVLLDDPVRSVIRWSHDPSLQTRAKTLTGKQLTAVDLQFYFLEDAQAFLDEGGFEDYVPHAKFIIRRWRDVLEKLKACDFSSLFGSIDWITKLLTLERVLDRRGELLWTSPEIKHLDHCYSNIDPSEGVYWSLERDGAVEQIVSEQEIQRCVMQPPDDTRAWTRAMLLRLAGPEQIEQVDWDRIRFRLRNADGTTSYSTLSMPNPLGMTRADNVHLFGGELSLEEVLTRLSAVPDAPFSNETATKPVVESEAQWQATLQSLQKGRNNVSSHHHSLGKEG